MVHLQRAREVRRTGEYVGASFDNEVMKTQEYRDMIVKLSAKHKVKNNSFREIYVIAHRF